MYCATKYFENWKEVLRAAKKSYWDKIVNEFEVGLDSGYLLRWQELKCPSANA